ncbi:MAG: hypothetical protein GT589_05750 [Peptoclostridium sp.]|uniref:hypothetical protein n=1 Tax=Peptoclostridium sp. TaxID=1904860 RepID=UPI00139DA76C|nr:hypothetical protein [Peptoclostridium sp.]MZQ75650.1 hypothetical protein [Peptoclostridium sp.]
MEKEILEILKNIQSDMTDMKGEISGIKNDMTDMKGEISGIKNDMSGMKGEISGIKDEISGIKTEMTGMKSTLDEHTQLLRALEHSAQVNKAEHDQMFNEIAHIRGDVEKLKNDFNIVERIAAKNWYDITTLKEAK